MHDPALDGFKTIVDRRNSSVENNVGSVFEKPVLIGSGEGSSFVAAFVRRYFDYDFLLNFGFTFSSSFDLGFGFVLVVFEFERILIGFVVDVIGAHLCEKRLCERNTNFLVSNGRSRMDLKMGVLGFGFGEFFFDM